MKWLFSITLFVFVLSIHANAQYFSTGQDPANVRWRQINTDHFQLIYPEDYESKAQQVAYVFEKVYTYGYRSLNHPPQKISVILHTHTVKSNGLVAWSPKRVELFTTPHQRIYAQDWLEQLATHEFRHVVQMDKIQSELPDLLPVLFGEQAAAAVVAAYLPFWFIEGDAVVTETALSKTGRGRLPSFLMENKAQTIEKGLYSYDKAYHGSYRDFVPNRYRFGYWFVGAIREKYGAKIWSDVLSEIAQKPLSITPFDKVLKRYSGKNKNQLYQSVFEEYRQDWQDEVDNLMLTDQTKITHGSLFFTNYKYSSTLADGSVVAVKESRDDIDRIVQIKDGIENTIYTPGIIFQESFSAVGNLLIWSEKRPDPRWSHADESVVVVVNTETLKKRSFKFDNKIFSPVISPDEKSFAAVEADRNNNYFLSTYDLQSGEKIASYSTPDNQCFFTPCWNDNGRTLYYISLSNKGKQLGALNLSNGNFENLSSPSFHDIRNPSYSSEKLYFTGSFTGIDNIYCFNIADQTISQITSVRFGADYPLVKDENLLFSNYDSDGYGLSQLKLADGLGTQFDQITPAKFELAEHVAQQEDTVLSFLGSEQVHFISKTYSKLGHLFNFHSWAPINMDVDNYALKPGVSLFSQNKLGTAETQLGYEYDPAEDVGKFKAGFTYSGLYPVFDSEISYGKRSSNYLLIENTVNQFGQIIDSDTTTQRFSWNELDVNLEMKLPIYFSQGKYVQVLQPTIGYSLRKVSHDDTTPDEYFEGHYHSMAYQLYFQNLLLKSELDVYPNWGQTAEVFYRHNPFNGEKLGSLAAVQSYLFFPGVMGNHGIRVYNGYQERRYDGTISYSDILKYPRGTNSFHNNKMYSFGIDYAMPLLYPDINFGPLAYLKRIRTSVFYDYAHLTGNIYDTDGQVTGTFSGALKSVGAELIGDGHFLRLVVPVSTGIRGSYHPNKQTFSFEFLFSVSFDSI
ncbi:TolB family protein [Sunxiuqinia sp. A32]|uniref:TolB family protein n=1 Tax=Sunxiuqinia sp. A32 TaxID=3461496 RepID=UPI0040456CC2